MLLLWLHSLMIILVPRPLSNKSTAPPRPRSSLWEISLNWSSPWSGVPPNPARKWTELSGGVYSGCSQGWSIRCFVPPKGVLLVVIPVDGPNPALVGCTFINFELPLLLRQLSTGHGDPSATDGHGWGSAPMQRVSEIQLIFESLLTWHVHCSQFGGRWGLMVVELDHAPDSWEWLWND